MDMLQQLTRTVGGSLRTLVTVVAVLVVVIPAAAWAGHQFTDVPNSNIFHDDIEWMADNGVTKGCNPQDNPPNTEYCPDDFVTRKQMAAFMHRLDSNDVFLRPGEVDLEGGDADTLDGKDSTDFLGTTAKAADADNFDGKDSVAFEQFGGTIPSGTTLTGNWYAAPSNPSVNNSVGFFEMTFPTTASAPADISDTDSNMGAGTGNGADNDSQCTGTVQNPTAPAGKVCWYVAIQSGLNVLSGDYSLGDRARGAVVYVYGDGTSNNQYARGSWAYTAP